MAVSGVDHVDAEALERIRGVCADGVGVEVVGPAWAGAPAELGDGEEIAASPAGLAQELAYEHLAAPRAVDVRGVDERDARVGRRAERVKGALFGHVAPLGPAELPGAKADFGDRYTVTKWAIL